jgi:hypothetical protein
MKLRILLLITFLAASAAVCRANEVDFFTSSGVINIATGTPVPIGDTVWLGYFPTNDPSFFLNNQTFGQLSASFTFLASIQFGQDASGVPGGGGIVPSPAGTYFGTVFGSVPTAPANNPSSQLFIWMFNANNPALATQWAITTNSAWLLPSGSGNIGIDPTINGTVPVGALGLITPNASGGFDVTLQIAPIPEPSTYFLGLVGGTAMLGALRLRRAHSRA